MNKEFFPPRPLTNPTIYAYELLGVDTHKGWLKIGFTDRDVKVIKFRGDSSKMSGIIEVRGIVNKDGTISYGEFTQYDNEFGTLIHFQLNYI